MRTRAEASSQRWAIFGFAVAILLLSFVVLKSAYYQLVLTQVLLWAVLSLAWNMLGYSLQANRKTLEGTSHPDRAAQLGYLNARVSEALAAGEPAISVDTKKS